MTEKLLIAGAGGQGIMLMGRILAEAVMRENKFVTWLPAYGAEVRGGTAYCMVNISDAEISSPYIEKADSLIIMNNPSLKRFCNRINNNATVIINSSLAVDKKIYKNRHLYKHPFSEIAAKMGNVKVANVIALGCYIKNTGVVRLKTVLQVISDIAPQNKRDLVEINLNALKQGATLR